MRRSFKGVSSGILIFIASVAVLMTLSSLFMDIISILHYQSTEYVRSMGYSALHELYSILLDKKRDKVYLYNAGASDILIDKLIAVSSSGETVVLNPLDACNSSTILSQHAIECSPNYEYTAVVTVNGVAIYPRSPLRMITIEYSTIHMIPLTFNYTTPADLVGDFVVDPRLVAYPTGGAYAIGMRGESVLRVSREYNNVWLETRGDCPFGLAIIGYDPSWLEEVKTNPSAPPRFRLVIGSLKYNNDECRHYRVGGSRDPVIQVGSRMYVWNFIGTVAIYSNVYRSYIACVSSYPRGCAGFGPSALSALGVWYYGKPDDGTQLRIYLHGWASRVVIFGRSERHVETSYYPYLYIGDVDGNGVPELIYTTEDIHYGSNGHYFKDYTGTNEYHFYWYRVWGPIRIPRWDDPWDYSTAPLVLRFNKIGRTLGNPDGSIDGSKYAGLLLYMNLLFHDNSYPDARQTGDIDKNEWILRIMIIDEYNREYTIREYRYQDLSQYHQTRVRDFVRENYFVKLTHSIYIPLPSQGRYWVALAIRDPYRYERRGFLQPYINDAEITIGIELVGVIPLYR
jgi:hypothetical protein